MKKWSQKLKVRLEFSDHTVVGCLQVPWDTWIGLSKTDQLPPRAGY